MRSILQVNEDVCFLCGRSGTAMDWHHCFGGSARHASEAYGLKFRLCHMGCHMYGKNAVHDNQAVMDELHREAQKKAMSYYGWDKDDFIRLFGKNYL